MLVDGLIDSYNHYHMGVTAENVAEKVELNKLTDLTDIQKEEDECVACQGQGKTYSPLAIYR